MTGSMVYRLSVGEVTAPHMATYIQALSEIQAISDDRGYNHVAGFHGAPNFYCWHHQNNANTDLQARLFLPWHRAYLWWLEQRLRDRLENAALPWWDWTLVRDVPAIYDDDTIGGRRNPLASSTIILPTVNPPINRETVRAPGSNPFVRLPRRREVERVLAQSDWASFSDLMESLHDRVHVWVGGDMASVGTAAFDPIFFAHHCMIDRIWYLWQVRHGNGGVPNALLDLELIPFGRRVKDVLDVQTLGYEYAVDSMEVPDADSP